MAVPEDPRLPLLPLAARQLGHLLCGRGAEGVGGRLPVLDHAVDARPLGLELAPLLLLLLPTAEHVAVLGAVLGLLPALFWVQLLEPAVEVSHDVLRADVLGEEFQLSVHAVVVDQVQWVLGVLAIARVVLAFALDRGGALAAVLWNVQADHFDRIGLLVDQIDGLLDLAEAALANVFDVLELLVEATGVQEVLQG